MTRLENWIEDEISFYEDEFGPLNAEGAAEYREHLSKTLHAAQLQVADQADELSTKLGDNMLAVMKEHSDKARDWSLREFFRRHW